jgi:hypothetical protein
VADSVVAIAALPSMIFSIETRGSEESTTHVLTET